MKTQSKPIDRNQADKIARYLLGRSSHRPKLALRKLEKAGLFSDSHLTETGRAFMAELSDEPRDVFERVSVLGTELEPDPFFGL